MDGIWHGANCQFHHDWNVFWFKWSVAAWLECVMVKTVKFSMARKCQTKKSELYKEEEELEEVDWSSLDQVPTTSHLVRREKEQL
jgi:hypothetical protein